MSATVRPGQVYVPRPDRELRYQHLVEAVEDGTVRLIPFNHNGHIPARRRKSFPLSKFLSCYRVLWETT